MSQVKRNNNDGRSRYTHQAYDVTFLGKSPETGPTGYNSRVSATYQAAVLFPEVPSDTTDVQNIGDLTEGVWISGLINHVKLSALSTMTLTLPAWNGEPEIELVAGADMALDGPITLDNPVWVPLTMDRPLTATFAAGTAGELATFSLLMTAAETAWK